MIKMSNHSNSNTFEQNNSNTSFEISKLDIQEPVNEFAKRIPSLIGQIQQFKINTENYKSDNEERCVKFCEELLQEHIRSLDKMNDCLNEQNNLNALLDKAHNKIQELERSLWYEKESKSDMKRKFEEDEQQNQEETIKKEKLISILQNKLKKLENERKQIYDEKQDLLVQYQTDLTRFEKERLHLLKVNKKLENDRELDELQSLNHKNGLINLTHELCVLFNLASEYRRKGAFFGKQFLNAFELVFVRLKINSTNVTFIQMPNESTSLNCSLLGIRDITSDELNNFNIILREKLIQNEEAELTIEEQTFMNSSEMPSYNFADNFENRLFGNETFKLASLTEGKQFIPSSFVDLIANDILNELIDEEIKHLTIKAVLELRPNELGMQITMCKEQINFMFKPDRSTFDESFQEESHNRFEESFSENLAKNCRSTDRPEVLLDILGLENSKTEFSRNYSQQIDSKISSTSTFIAEHNKSRRSNSQTTLNDKSSKVFCSMTFDNDCQNKSEIQSIDKPKKRIHLNASKLSTVSRSSRRSSSMSSCETTAELIVTLNNKDRNSRSDGESVVDSNEIGLSTSNSRSDSDLNSMQLTNINNLSNVFDELSSNLKLNSTVKTNEKGFSSEIKLDSLKLPEDRNSTFSSDMRLSDDENYFKETVNSNEDNESDLLVEVMMSKGKRSYNIEEFYSTIRHESNHSTANMDLTYTTKSSRSNDDVSSTLASKFNDEGFSRESEDSCSLHSSNSRCRFRKRKPTWSPYFSPLLSLLTLLYPLFVVCKYMFVVMFFFVGFGVCFFYHFHALKIYYTSWQEIGSNLLNLYVN